MSKDICAQLVVHPGDRVQIVLHELCLKAGGGKLYPHDGTGTVREYVVSGKKNHGHYDDYGKLCYVVYDEPFIQLEPGEKARVISADWVPTWLLIRLPEPKPED